MGASLTGSAPTARTKSADSISAGETDSSGASRRTAVCTFRVAPLSAKNAGPRQPLILAARASTAWVSRLLRTEPTAATD